MPHKNIYPGAKALLAVPFAAAGLVSCAEKPQQQKQPNILFIMTDDHTTQAMSCYGGTLLQTPNMDRLAREGMRLDKCYATNALSGPSRACILTGKFGHENGFTDNASVFDGSQQTFPKLLQEAGYETAMIGKWHLITEPQGFDFWSVLSGQEEQGDYYKPGFWEMGREITEQGYVTDVITDKVLSWLESRSGASSAKYGSIGKGNSSENGGSAKVASARKPFCLMFHHKAPHRNWMPAPEHLGEFNDVVFPEPDNLFDDYSTRSAAASEQDMSIAKTFTDDWDLKLMTREEMLANPDNRLSKVYLRMPEEVQHKWDSVYAGRIAEARSGKLQGRELVRWKYQQYMKDYLATVLSVDESIGRVLDYLEKTGELDNTIIVYTSDQGFFLGEHGWFDKRFMYEECQRMPLLVRFPGSVKAGSTSSALCMNVDFAPTFLDYAGVEVPSDIQGTSLRPVLDGGGKTPEDWRKAVYYHYYEYPAEHSVKRHYGIRTDRYKLIHFYNDIDSWELYDEQEDPKEMRNLYGLEEYADIRKDMLSLMDSVQVAYGDVDPCEKERVLYKGDRRYMNRTK